MEKFNMKECFLKSKEEIYRKRLKLEIYKELIQMRISEILFNKELYSIMTGLDWCRYNRWNGSKNNRFFKHSYRPMKKKEEGKERTMKNKIKADLEISFLASQAFLKKVLIIKRIFIKNIHSTGILQKMIYHNKIWGNAQYAW